MAKESEIIVNNNLYSDGVPVSSQLEHTKKVEYTRKASGENTIVITAPSKSIDFEGITSKVLIFENLGDGVIEYKLSGAVANTGTLSTGGILVIHNGSISGMIINTASAEPVKYKYEIYG